MGYYTRFKLSTKPKTAGILDEQADGDQRIRDLVGDNAEETKWYEHDEDLRRISAKYPGVLFTLRGEGEEAGDVWVKYFRDGKMQAGETTIAYEPFDEAKLK